MGVGDRVQLTTRPFFSRAISPASSSTFRCFMKPVSDMPCGAASAVTVCGPASSDCRMARRVPSASAANTASSAGPEKTGMSGAPAAGGGGGLY